MCDKVKGPDKACLAAPVWQNTPPNGPTEGDIWDGFVAVYKA